MISLAVFLNRLNPVQESKPFADDRRPAQIGMAIPWNPAAEHPDPLNAASADNGPYTVRVGFDHSLVVAVPRRNNFVWMVRSTDILRDGKIVYHWDAYLATTSLIDHDVLYREEETVAADNDGLVGDVTVTKLIVAIDLRDGHQLQESGLTDAPHPHDDPGLCFEVRDGRLVIWADDANGRFAEVKDLQTGKSVGYCFYDRQQVVYVAREGDSKTNSNTMRWTVVRTQFQPAFLTSRRRSTLIGVLLDSHRRIGLGLAADRAATAFAGVDPAANWGGRGFPRAVGSVFPTRGAASPPAPRIRLDFSGG